MPNLIVEKEYKNVMLRIGAVMLMHTVLINILYGSWNYLPIEGLSEKTYAILYSLLNSAVYLFSFLFPAGFFYMISKKNSRTKSVLCDVRLPATYPFMMFAGFGIILFFAYVNSYAINWFNYYDSFIYEENLSDNYLLILSIISTAIVPAFCEEFLFRGVVLTNLLPYGKNGAIIISAILFGLMHQNVGQMIYTTVAGLILGFIYVKTRSIWGCVILHFVNNFNAVISSLMYNRLDDFTAAYVTSVIDLVIMGIGLLSLVVFVVIETCRNKRNKDSDRFIDGSFDMIIEYDDSYVKLPISMRKKFRFFFVPTVSLFVIISCLIMMYYVFIAIGLL